MSAMSSIQNQCMAKLLSVHFSVLELQLPHRDHIKSAFTLPSDPHEILQSFKLVMESGFVLAESFQTDKLIRQARLWFPPWSFPFNTIQLLKRKPKQTERSQGNRPYKWKKVEIPLLHWLWCITASLPACHLEICSCPSPKTTIFFVLSLLSRSFFTIQLVLRQQCICFRVFKLKKNKKTKKPEYMDCVPRLSLLAHYSSTALATGQYVD